MNRNPRAVATSPTFGRRGISLTEVLVVISLSTFVMGTAGMLMQQLLRADRSLARGAETAARLSRLDLIFRRDVWSAVEADFRPTPRGVRLILSQEEGGRVVYESDGRLLRREVLTGETVTHRDQFVFPLDSQVLLERLETSRRAALTVSTSSMPVDQPSIERYQAPLRQFRIEASIGRAVHPPGDAP